MVSGTSRMSSVTIKRQPMHQQKRKCTRADPTQRRILLKNYESQARPSGEQFADMSRETSLPVEWIKKWFLRKRKADGKNKTLTPTMPTFAENDPPAYDGQTLGHAHSKFWSLDAFVAADSTSFSPSAGRIPKFYGRHKHGLPSGNPEDHATDTRENEEERAITSPRVSTGTGDDHTAPCGSVGLTNDPREASTGNLSPSVGEDAPGLHSEDLNVTLAVDGLGSTLLPEVSSTERLICLDDSHNEVFSGSESVGDSDFTLTSYTTPSMSSPFDTIDDFILASRDLGFTSDTSCHSSGDFELGSFNSAAGRLDTDLGPFPGYLDAQNHMTSTFGGSSVFYESLLLQAANQDQIGDSINLADCSGLLDVDFCLGTAPMTTGHELESASALDLALLNFGEDPTAFTASFGSFDVKDTAEGVDSTGEAWWTDAFDAMLV